MGSIHPHCPVMPILAAFSRHRQALQWARQRAEDAWGPVALVSDSFLFDETDYYASTMGTDLRKMFFAFDRSIDPAELVVMKRMTNEWEQNYRDQFPRAEHRPLNLDPGYLSEAKLVLASTKDHCHRIYLSDGIYAEVTLIYQNREWQHREWTYPNYRRADYQEFFTACRQHLRATLRGSR